MLTEPSQVIEAGPGEGEQQRLAHLRKSRPGQVCFDLSCVLIAGAHVSARGLAATIRLATSDRAMQGRARAIGQKLREEDGGAQAVRSIEELLSGSNCESGV